MVASTPPMAPQAEEATSEVPEAPRAPEGGRTAQVGEVAVFASSPDRLNADLKQTYVPFTFQYPTTWKVVQRGEEEGQSNYVKIEKQDGSRSTIENFAVGVMTGSGSLEQDKSLYEQLAFNLSEQFSKGFQDYEKTGGGAIRFNGYDAYQLLFTAKTTDDAQTIPLCGRLIFISGGNVGRRNGVILLMLATDKSPIRDPEQIGASGDYATILNSFELTK
jgi:hypothetical protein